MFGPILSVLLMGMVPVWGVHFDASVSREIRIAPPTSGDVQLFQSLETALSASGAIIVDLESGQTVYRRSAAVARPMASLTKLMTALIIVEHHSLDEVVLIPDDIREVVGTVAYLPAGERFTVGDLLSALLIMSGNDAAVTLARYHSGSMESFAAEMNERAKQLGLQDTSYQNPTGLDAPSQRSTPQDLAWLAMFVMRNEDIATRMGAVSAQIRSLSGKTLTLTHTHQLLRTEADILAGKTGTTDEAGQCLLSIVEGNGRRYITVLLHSQDRYGDLRAILTLLSQ